MAHCDALPGRRLGKLRGSLADVDSEGVVGQDPTEELRHGPRGTRIDEKFVGDLADLDELRDAGCDCRDPAPDRPVERPTGRTTVFVVDEACNIGRCEEALDLALRERLV